MTEITKAYKFKTYENKAKKHETRQIIRARQKILVDYSIDAYELLRTTGEVPLYKPGIKSDKRLAQVVLRDCWMQVKNTYSTILPAMKNYGKHLITSLEIKDDELRTQLYYINKYGKWLITDSIKKFTVTQEAKEYSRLIFETIFQEFKSKLPLLGDKDSIIICSSGKLETKKNPGNNFDYWLNVHGMKSRKPIKIPIKTNDYYESLPGDRNLTVSLKLNEEGELEVIVSKTSKVEEYKPLKSEELGLDWGFKSLFSTSNGRLLGLQFHKKLIEWDEKLQALTAQLQKLNISLKSNKRYKKLQVRIRAFIKN